MGQMPRELFDRCMHAVGYAASVGKHLGQIPVTLSRSDLFGTLLLYSGLATSFSQRDLAPFWIEKWFYSSLALDCLNIATDW